MFKGSSAWAKLLAQIMKQLIHKNSAGFGSKYKF